MNNLVDQKRKNTIYFIKSIVECTIKMQFKIEETINPIELRNTPTLKDWLRIALNLQIKIVNDHNIRKYITNKLNVENLSIWAYLFNGPLNALTFVGEVCGDTIPQEELIPIVVFYGLNIKLDCFLNCLDNQFGNDFFPNFTFENAAVIVFKKVDLQNYTYKLLSNYNKDIFKYIKYLPFVMKIIIEKIGDININPFSKQSNIEIKTYSASENILLFLNSNYNTFVK